MKSKKREKEDKGKYHKMTEICTKGQQEEEVKREKEKERCREVVGGSGPYREAGTTLASAILSAKDIYNHLVPLALSHDTHAVRSLLGHRSMKGSSSFPPRI